MTKAVAVRAFDAVLAEPVLSFPMQALIGEVQNPHPDIGLSGLEVTAPQRAEAVRLLSAYDRLFVPAEADMVTKWLSLLITAVSNPPQPDVFFKNVESVTGALRDIPGVVVNPDTARRAVQKFKYWPSSAEIYEFLRLEAAPLVAKRWALQRIKDAKAKVEAVRVPPTPEEIAAADAKTKEALAAMRGGRPDEPEPRRAVRPSYLTPEQLAAAGGRPLRGAELPPRPKPTYLNGEG